MRIAVPAIEPAALADWDPRAPIVALAGETMGTVWRARFAAPPGHDPARLRGAIQTLLDALVAEMSHWKPDSLLSRFNAAAAGSWFALPDDVAAVMAAGLDVAARSGGCFDPAIGALTDLWGLGPTPRAGTPTEDELEAARASGGWQRLSFDPLARRLHQPGGVRLDLSGIAKGHAVDRVSALLAAQGIAHSLVEVGGELVGRGLRPDGDPWWVDLETPGEAAPPLRVALHQRAVATSGDYVRGRHTIDPRSGRPVAHVLAVSVLDGSAMLADAWATALGVADRDAAAVLAAENGLAVRALYRHGGTVEEWVSPRLLEMLG